MSCHFIFFLHIRFQDDLAKASEKSASSSPDGETNATSETCEDGDLVDAALPPNDKKQQRISELQKLKANCKPEQLNVIREHCEVK